MERPDGISLNAAVWGEWSGGNQAESAPSDESLEREREGGGGTISAFWVLGPGPR